MVTAFPVKEKATPSLLLFGFVLVASLPTTVAFQPPRPVLENAAGVPTATQRGYSLDSYLETLSEIQSTVHSAAGSSNTQAYLQSLASLNNDKDHSGQSDETTDFTSRTSFSCLNYLESLSDVPSSKREDMIASSAPKMFETTVPASPLTTDTVEPVPKAMNELSTGSSLKVDTPGALLSTPAEEAQSIHPSAAVFTVSNQSVPASNTRKKRQAFSPDSTMPSLQRTEFTAPPKYTFEDKAPLAMKDTDEVKTTNTRKSSSEELLKRIAMAAEYVAAEQPWDVETIKGTSPLTSVTNVLADFNEHNSHVALQNGQDEVTKSLTKWIKSTQKIEEQSTTTISNIPKEAKRMVQNMDMSIDELSERIAQGFFSLGELVVTALNLVAESVGGKSLSVAAKSAQQAATEAIASAVASVMTTVQKVGDVSVADVMQSMVELIILISRVIFRIFNGALEIVSGKSAGQMGQAVTNSFEKEAKALSATKKELSEKSLYELVVMLGKFELEAAEVVMATASNAVQSLEVGTMLGRPQKTLVGI